MSVFYKVILFFSMLSMFFSLQKMEARTDSLKIWRFVYEFADVNFKERGYNDLMNLDVKSDGSSLFYSIYNTANTVHASDAEDLDALVNSLNSTKKGATYMIARNFATNEMTCVTDAPDKFFYQESDLRQNWEIIDKDTMTICGYACKKAVTFFAGRTWIAWFAEDLPISCGPWKLNGLPGLILSAHDADNYFNFLCVGVEQTKILPWDINSKGYIKCTNEEYQKQLRLQAADPVNYALRKLGLPTVSADEVIITGDTENNLPHFEKIYMEKISDDEK